MTVSTDLVATWRSPRAALRRHLSRGVSEPFAFTLLLVFLVLAFVGQWPAAAREAFLADEPSAAPRILARAMAVLASATLSGVPLAAREAGTARGLRFSGRWPQSGP
jgi:hypothetical protein